MSKAGFWITEDELAAAELFRLHFPDGRVVKLYGNGQTKGLPSGTVVVNKIPFLRHAAQTPPIPADQARGNQLPHTDPEALHQYQQRRDQRKPCPLL